jgi:hypothetical protein
LRGPVPEKEGRSVRSCKESLHLTRDIVVREPQRD